LELWESGGLFGTFSPCFQVVPASDTVLLETQVLLLASLFEEMVEYFEIGEGVGKTSNCEDVS